MKRVGKVEGFVVEGEGVGDGRDVEDCVAESHDGRYAVDSDNVASDDPTVFMARP